MERRIAAVVADMNRWLAREDPMLGPVPEPTSDGVLDVYLAHSGRAAGLARSAHASLESPIALWGASSTDQLQLRLTQDAEAGDVAEILDAWLARPPVAVAEPGGDHARVLRLPHVARAAVLPLLSRGFHPGVSTLVRRVRPHDGGAPGDLEGVELRAPRAEDHAEMAALMTELIETESAFGVVRRRAPSTGDHYVAEAIGFGAPWAYVAQVGDGGPVVGWASLAPAEASRWAAASVSQAPVHYLGVATVTAAHRSRGVGRALARRLLAQAAAAGAAVVVLDACVLNPWSTPFWQRLGFRPLWTTWQRLPDISAARGP